MVKKGSDRNLISTDKPMFGSLILKIICIVGAWIHKTIQGGRYGEYW
jgi:hypothetical protein